MNQALVGLLRGLAYAIIYGVVHFLAVNLGASGVVPLAYAGIVTAVLGSVDHALLPTP